MRNLLATAGLATVLTAFAAGTSLCAQDSSAKPYEESTSQTTTPRLSFEQRNIYERARFEARERKLRMQSHKWVGYSPSRPVYRMLEASDSSGHPRGPWDPYYGFSTWYAPVRIAR